MRHPTALAALVLAAACLPAAAQSLKPGLWQVTNKMTGNPEMEKAMAEMEKQMAAMPPEQRKQMEAMMASRGMKMTPGAGGGGMSMQICMTKEMVERDEVPMNQGDCKSTVSQKSAGYMKMSFTCSNPPSSGEGEFRMNGNEGYTSKVTVRTTVQGRPETTQMEGSGKWLSTDCGNVKPMQMPPKK